MFTDQTADSTMINNSTINRCSSKEIIVKVEDIALVLASVSQDQHVRVLEGIAATIVNRLASREDGSGPWLRELGAARLVPPELTEAPAFACCRRIAMRALRGTLADPVHGATAFHRIDELPEWARGLMPVALLGSFLFYRE